MICQQVSFFHSASAQASRNRLRGLTLLGALFLLVWSAGAQDLDEQYLRIYKTIQQGDALVAGGSNAPAVAKYENAEDALKRFKTVHPNWNPSVVAFRLNYLTERITTLTGKAPGAAAREESSATESSSSGKTASTTPQVKLLEPGAEPRKVLRLHPKVGEKESLAMTIQLNMDMQMGEAPAMPIKMPKMTFNLDSTVQAVANGEIKYDLVVSDAALAEDADVMPQVAASMKTALEGVKGMTGTMTINDRRVPKDAQFKVASGGDAQANQAADQMKEAFGIAGALLPDEAVGAGAKWEAKRIVKSQGMNIDQTTIYELTSLDGELVNAKSAITQNAANQKVANPSMPGVKVDLKKMTGTGGGELTLDLTRVMPPKANYNVRSEMNTSMDMGGQKQAMNMKMDVNLRLEGK